MKDIYKQKVDDKIENCITRAKIVKSMVTGERPADSKMADTYLRDVLNELESIREIVVKG
jgi:hypothetical protein